MKITATMKKYILPNVPYFLMFWFFGKLGEAYRLTEGSDLLYRLITILRVKSII